MDRRGFAYIIAVLILGLLAFMGMFLMQSSSTEYSHAAVSVYATIAQQIAESAADEAFLALDEQFQDRAPGGKMENLLKICATSKLPADGGATGLNPDMLGMFPDFKGYAKETQKLIDSRLTRAGFSIEKMILNLTNCRPIDYEMINKPESIYRPKDRPDKAFDFDDWGGWAADYQLTAGFDIYVNVQVGGRKAGYIFQIYRDVKVVNVGPIARNYSLFSIQAIDERKMEDDVANDLDDPLGGRLVLWNHPFQSRVYLHGPCMVGIENPDMEKDPANKGIYSYIRNDGRPGFNLAFTYDDTYNGFSYLPFPARALWEAKKGLSAVIFGSDAAKETELDFDGFTDYEKKMFETNTYRRGLIPRKESKYLDNLKDFVGNPGEKLYRDYVRGKSYRQTFLPAGPFCRYPWKYVSDTIPPKWNNILENEDFPGTDNKIRVEHRWAPNDKDYDKNTQIFAKLNIIRFGNLYGLVGIQEGYPMEQLDQFAVSWGNWRDAEGWLEGFKQTFLNAVKGAWSTLTGPFKLIYYPIQNVWNRIFPPKDPKNPTGYFPRNWVNFYPTNWKYFDRAATRYVDSLEQLASPQNKNLILLNGCYRLGRLNTTGDMVYFGKGIISCLDYNSQDSIKGSIRAMTAESGARSDSHLTLVYFPGTPSKAYPYPPINEGQLKIEGTGKVIEASVFSAFGIKTDATGKLSETDFASLELKPSYTPKEWAAALGANSGEGIKNIQARVNSIEGNYVTIYMNKRMLSGDLWVFHDTNNPLFFTRTGTGDSAVDTIKQVAIDSGEEATTKQFYVDSHIVALSPKIRHFHYRGSL